MTIGIFGAQGKFGSSLFPHLQRIAPASTKILPTADKLHNKEIAELCDLVILCVQPKKTEVLLKEIAPVLKPSAQIISFAANCPLKNLAAVTSKPVACGIADPWWNVSAFLLSEDFSTKNLNFIFDNLTKEKPKTISSELEMYLFSILISYLFVILLLEKLNRIQDAHRHLDFITAQLKISETNIQNFIPEGDPEKFLVLIATKGGISEKFIQALESEPSIAPEELLDFVLKK